MRMASIATARARAVVGGAGAGVPGVEVGAHHDDLGLLVGAGDLGHGVVGHQVVVVEAGLDVDLQLDLELAVEQPADAVVVLGGHDQGGDPGVLVLLPRAAARHAHDAAVALARLDRGQRLLRDEELAQLPLELEPPDQAPRGRRAARPAAGASPRGPGISNRLRSSSCVSV